MNWLFAIRNSTLGWNLIFPKQAVSNSGFYFFRKCYIILFPNMAVLSRQIWRIVMSKQKHLTIEKRTVIEIGLGKRSSFKAIASLTGKDCTTVSKEIRNHRVYEKTGAYGKAFNDCLNSFTHSCSTRHAYNRCTSLKRPCWSCGRCTEYVKYSCPKLNKPLYVCNGCPKN